MPLIGIGAKSIEFKYTLPATENLKGMYYLHKQKSSKFLLDFRSTIVRQYLTFQMVCGPVIVVERDVKGRNFDVPSYNSQSSSGKSEET